MAAVLPRRFEHPFHFAFLIGCTAVIFYGFSHTAGRLFDPTQHLPWIFHVHALLTISWLFLMIVQSGLVQSGNVARHRRLGIWGAVLGTAVVVVALIISVVGRRLDVASSKPPIDPLTWSFLALPAIGALTFGVLLAAAIYWRRRSDWHRRLMMLVMVTATVAGLGRFPPLFPDALSKVIGIPEGFWWCFVGSDLLMALLMVRDRVVEGRVHRVYWIAAPLIIISQIATEYLIFGQPAWWMAVAHGLID